MISWLCGWVATFWTAWSPVRVRTTKRDERAARGWFELGREWQRAVDEGKVPG